MRAMVDAVMLAWGGREREVGRGRAGGGTGADRWGLPGVTQKNTTRKQDFAECHKDSVKAIMHSAKASRSATFGEAHSADSLSS
ncbi:hypothetical protein GUJ93_ZPchr0003g17235 [Zizania palustris]|uniref:Uncharacterized protein n=1 Tax=Zizania palustris TaxID=103762 RepID=A0A8J5SUF5_ZIZPA|nr:hypothetical protein GUJ93_ZPchr0003g17235 [Zizania palustris]